MSSLFFIQLIIILFLFTFFDIFSITLISFLSENSPPVNKVFKDNNLHVMLALNYAQNVSNFMHN